ncbi:MAG: hypothetical protein KDD32_06975 [Bacteroidetes bacterium]|nr:hypothetical protein [Bacteroidota bacterium]
MNRLLLATIITLFGFATQAQDLIIEYDYIGKNSQYLKINKHGDTVVVKSPVVKAGTDVKVNVINFNENALFTETEVTNENLIESSNPFGLLNMLSPIFNVASKGVLTNMFDERGVDISEIEFGFSSDVANDPQLKNVQDKFMTLNRKVYDLAQLEQTIQDIEFGLNQLYILSRNTTLYPDEMKEQARQIVSSTLKNGDQPELSSFYRKREAVLKESREQITSVKLISKDILKYENQPQQDNFGFASAENLKVYQELTNETESLVEAIEDFESTFSKDEVEQMLQLMQQLYFSISNSSFTYTTNALAEGDRTNINLVFYSIPPAGTIDNSDEDIDTEDEEDDSYEDDFGYTLPTQKFDPKPLRTKSFKINVSGGLKISPSIGVAFPTYFGASKDYYARGDSTIVETEGSNFIPNVAAFVNFYPYTGKAVNFGGSFGIGIPITGGTISPSFLLGGSLVLGDKYRIAVSGGMATGPIKRLENGFEVGQNLEQFQELKTKVKYAVGFYSSISFTIGVGS